MKPTLIDKEAINLNSTDAEKIALRFNEIGGVVSRSENDATPLTVSEVKDPSTGKTLVYIVNKGNNEGYMVISATKTESPILIYSETGCFDPQNDPAAKGYFDEYVNQISSVTGDQTDSLRRVHAIEWAVFEKSEKQPQSRAIGTVVTDIESAIATQISKKQAQGYTYVGKVTAA